MVDFVHILKNLPPDGTRTDTGLALRLTTGNGMAVLGCSRVGDVPSEAEITAVVDAIRKVYAPSMLFRADQPETRIVETHPHTILRLYWPIERISIVPNLPNAEKKQRALPFLSSQGAVNQWT